MAHLKPRTARVDIEMAQNQEPEEKTLPLVWLGLEDVEVRTASHLISQFREDLFVLNFGFANPPILMGSPEEVRNTLDSMEHVVVTPIARLGLTVSAMESFVGVLQENLERYRRKADAERDEP